MLATAVEIPQKVPSDNESILNQMKLRYEPTYHDGKYGPFLARRPILMKVCKQPRLCSQGGLPTKGSRGSSLGCGTNSRCPWVVILCVIGAMSFGGRLGLEDAFEMLSAVVPGAKS